VRPKLYATFPDGERNITEGACFDSGEAIVVEAERNLVFSSADRKVALLGVEDLVVVDARRGDGGQAGSFAGREKISRVAQESLIAGAV
jgi:hypothetical protein